MRWSLVRCTECRETLSYAGTVLLLLRRLVLALALLGVAAVAWLFAQALEVPTVPFATATAPQVAPETTVLSTKRLAAVLVTQPESVDLGALLAKVRAEVPERACAIIRWGDSELVSIRPDAPLAPGLAQLFLTGLAALDVLGPDFVFTTSVVSPADVTGGGDLQGGLLLIGGGDPVLQTTDWALQRGQSVWTSFEVLADQVASAGATNIVGGIAAVDDRYDEERTIPGWSTEWPEARQIGSLGALQVNDGVIGDEIEPDPGLAAVRVLSDLLADRGIATNGPLVRLPAAPEAEDETIVLGQVTSAPLRAIVRDMWHQADPTTAELLLKEVSLTASETAAGASSAEGGRVVQQVVAALGAELPLSPRDGSGLDPTAQLRCDTLVDTIASLPAEHQALTELAAMSAPAFNGQFRLLDSAIELGMVGGGDRNARGLVGRAETAGGTLTFATLVNNAEQLTAADLVFQTRIVEAAVAIAAEG